MAKGDVQATGSTWTRRRIDRPWGWAIGPALMITGYLALGWSWLLWVGIAESILTTLILLAPEEADDGE